MQLSSNLLTYLHFSNYITIRRTSKQNIKRMKKFCYLFNYCMVCYLFNYIWFCHKTIPLFFLY